MQIEFEVMLINNDLITLEELAQIIYYLMEEQVEMQYNEINN